VFTVLSTLFNSIVSAYIDVVLATSNEDSFLSLSGTTSLNRAPDSSPLYIIVMQIMRESGLPFYAVWCYAASTVLRMFSFVYMMCGSILDAMLGCEYASLGIVEGGMNMAGTNISRLRRWRI
jgi:hypothetical protein